MTEMTWLKRSGIVLAGLGLVAVAASGCAKRPATTQAFAPAPTAATPTGAGAGTGAGTGAGAGAGTGTKSAGAGVGTGAGAGQAARPSPADFREHPDVKPIFFDFDKYDIKPEAARALDQNAAWLKRQASVQLLIEGHTDERGTNEYNLALGERRAKATMSYLGGQGIPTPRITILSYGEEKPSCREKTESCWAKNRSARILVKLR